jgi:hypothetical protein
MASGNYAKSKVKKWFKGGYNTSSQYNKLGKRFNKYALMIIELYADLMAEYMDLPPSSWDGEETYEVLVVIIPRKAMFENGVFEVIIPVMVSFFEYLGENTIEKGWAEELINSIKGKEKELLRNVKYQLSG